MRSSVLPVPVVVALLALLALCLDVQGQEAHRSLRGFYPTGEFDLVVAGVKREGEILFSRRAAAYLIAPAGSEEVYLLQQRLKTVSAISADLLRRENGDVDVPENAKIKQVGSFSLDSSGIRIQTPTLTGTLQSRPPLIGPHPAAVVLEHSPQYGLVQRAYRPDEDAIRRIDSHAGARVEVIFGSWCPRCQQTLGKALRVESELKNGRVGFLFHGLPTPPAAWREARFLETHIKALPTAIVWVNKREAGRIAPNDWDRFEAALARILAR
jgi:hypothetical protein